MTTVVPTIPEPAVGAERKKPGIGAATIMLGISAGSPTTETGATCTVLKNGCCASVLCLGASPARVFGTEVFGTDREDTNC